MVKLVCFLKRKGGLTLDEFYDHSFNRHGPMLARRPSRSKPW